MGIPVVAGRGFTFDDDTGTERVIVINETGAATLWPGQDAVGRGVRLYDGISRVVGVVGDVRHNDVREASGVEMYLSTSQAPVRNLSLVVRATGDPLALSGQIRAAVREVDPRVPFTDFRPVGRLVSRALSAQRFFTSMLSGFAGIALVLASLGIYGVISYSVSQRRAEIGIRMALGALPGRVLREEIRRGAVLAVAGLAIGLVGALLASRFVASELYGVGATDPATYAATALGLLVVAMLAGLIPSWRAARTNPVKALRDA
jgi:cell division protein FtsX